MDLCDTVEKITTVTPLTEVCPAGILLWGGLDDTSVGFMLAAACEELLCPCHVWEPPFGFNNYGFWWVWVKPQVVICAVVSIIVVVIIIVVFLLPVVFHF